jgi:AsmA-like C-terminal region
MGKKSLLVCGPGGMELHGKGIWTWVAVAAIVALIVVGVVAEVMVHRAGPILKARVVETLSARFDSRVELDDFDVSVLRGLEARGHGLKIYPTAAVVAAGADKPMIEIDDFSFHTRLMGLFAKPMHVSVVHVTGLHINIPPKEMRQAAKGAPRKDVKIKIVVDEIICNDSQLVIGTLKPGKDPKDFELRQIELHNVGPDDPWQYVATLTNAIPKGDIHATGTFGPWVNEDPGASLVTGHYTFDHADLNPIKGIGGILSSVGDFNGELDKIEVSGTTDTPDFSLDTASHRMHLKTTFRATVDGTSGDTYLHSVDAVLGQTQFATSGAVINVKGKGHIIDLDVTVPDGRIQDFLQLAVKTEPVVMTGRIGMKTKLHIRPGAESVSKKISMKGGFTLRTIHFSNPEVQDKVDMLSLRAQGDPKDAKPGAEDVDSQMKGEFTMDRGELNFSDLNYVLPGAQVNLAGIYSLDGNTFDFHGKVRTDAKLSKMVGSKWKSLMLKPVDPFFKKNGAGAEIPIKVTGTKGAPKFGLELHQKKDAVPVESDKKP